MGYTKQDERYARATADAVPEDMAMLAYLNIFEPEREEAEAQAERELAVSLLPMSDRVVLV